MEPRLPGVQARGKGPTLHARRACNHHLLGSPAVRSLLCGHCSAVHRTLPSAALPHLPSLSPGISAPPPVLQNDNSIAMVNLCRDEITHTLKHKIDQVGPVCMHALLSCSEPGRPNCALKLDSISHTRYHSAGVALCSAPCVGKSAHQGLAGEPGRARCARLPSPSRSQALPLLSDPPSPAPPNMPSGLWHVVHHPRPGRRADLRRHRRRRRPLPLPALRGGLAAIAVAPMMQPMHPCMHIELATSAGHHLLLSASCR